MEALTKLTAFRGFAGTSVLIIVGVATDTARKASTLICHCRVVLYEIARCAARQLVWLSLSAFHFL